MNTEGKLSFKGELETKFVPGPFHPIRLSLLHRMKVWWHSMHLSFKIKHGIAPHGRHDANFVPRPHTFIGLLYCKLRGML